MICMIPVLAKLWLTSVNGFREKSQRYQVQDVYVVDKSADELMLCRIELTIFSFSLY